MRSRAIGRLPAHLKRVVLNGLAVVGATQLAVLCTPLVPALIRSVTPQDAAPRIGLLIVLGGDNPRADRMIGFTTYWRCYTAVQAWRHGKFERVLVSGGDGNASNMASFLVANGVPASAIILEPAAMTTRENAVNSTRVAMQSGYREAALVTSDYHMRRALSAFRKTGLTVRPIVSPEGRYRCENPLDRWPVLLMLASEAVKTPWYAVRGYI